MHRRKREKNPIFSKQLTINFTGDALFWMHLHVLALSCRKHLRYSDNWSWDTGDLWVPLPFPASCQLRAPSECAQHGEKSPSSPKKHLFCTKQRWPGAVLSWSLGITSAELRALKVWCSKPQFLGMPHTGCAAYAFPYKRGLCGLIFLPGTPRGS